MASGRRSDTRVRVDIDGSAGPEAPEEATALTDEKEYMALKIFARSGMTVSFRTGFGWAWDSPLSSPPGLSPEFPVPCHRPDDISSSHPVPSPVSALTERARFPKGLSRRRATSDRGVRRRAGDGPVPCAEGRSRVDGGPGQAGRDGGPRTPTGNPGSPVRAWSATSPAGRRAAGRTGYDRAATCRRGRSAGCGTGTRISGAAACPRRPVAYRRLLTG